MKKNFIAITDYSTEEIKSILSLAVDLKQEWLLKGNKPIFAGKVLGMIFQKPQP